MSQTLNLAIVLDSDGSLPDGTVTGSELANNSVEGRHLVVGSLNTDQFAEGTANVFFTNSRARLAITVTGAGAYDNANGIVNIGGPNLNTNNVIEGSANLYFTNARSRSAISAFDSTIIYDSATGTIRANAAALGGIGGGPNVITVNGQNGVVTLTTTNIAEGANLYFTSARARSALNSDGSVVLNSSNGLVSVGQAVRPNSNVTFNTVTTKSLVLQDSGNSSIVTSSIYYDDVANALYFTSNLVPAFDDTQDLGSLDNNFANLYIKNIAANDIVVEGRVTAQEFFGNFSGDIITNISVFTDFTSLVIDGASNPSLYLPKGSKVIFDVSSNNLVGVGFDIGNLVNDNIQGGNTISGVSYFINNIGVSYDAYRESFTGSNVRSVVYTIPQSAQSTLIYYSTYFNNWRGTISVAPPATSDDITEGENNLFYTDQRVTDLLLSIADANTGISYDESTGLLGLSQDIDPTASPTFQNITANTVTGTFVGDLIGNVLGSISSLDITTDNVDEGTVNLYFSQSRVRTSIDNGYGLEYNPISGIFSLSQTPANVGSYGNSKYITSITIDDYGRVMGISNVMANLHTSEIPESPGNLYYTNARVIAAVTDLLGNTGTGNVNANIIITNSISANTITTGNTVIDNSGVTNGSTIITNNSVTSTTFTGNLTGNVTGYVSTISNFSTSNLAEGSNLYFTNARVISVVTDLLGNVGTGNVTANVITAETIVGNLTGNVTGYVSTISNFSTSNLTEGSSLYFTNARVYAALYNAQSNLANIGVNRIYINDGVDSGIHFDTTGMGDYARIVANTAGDGTNYFTIAAGDNNNDYILLSTTNDENVLINNYVAWHDGIANARVRGAISVTGTGSYNSSTGVITITGGVESVNGSTGNVTLTTTNIPEGANLYFTNTRARSSIGVTGIGLNYYSSNGNVALDLSSIASETLRFDFVTSNGTSIYTGTDATGNTLALPPANQPSATYVYLNGVLLTPTEDYSVNTTHLVFTQATDANSNLTIINQKAGLVFTNPGVNSINGLQGDVSLSTANLVAGPNLTSGNVTVTYGLTAGEVTANTITTSNIAASNISSYGLNVTGVINVTGAMLEKANIRAFMPSGTITANVLTDTILYYTGNISQNVVFNMTGLNNAMQVSEIVTFTLIMPVGATPFAVSTFQVDGSNTSVKWGGSRQHYGTVANVDFYTISVIKTSSSPAYSIFVNTVSYN